MLAVTCAMALALRFTDAAPNPLSGEFFASASSAYSLRQFALTVVVTVCSSLLDTRRRLLGKRRSILPRAVVSTPAATPVGRSWERSLHDTPRFPLS